MALREPFSLAQQRELCEILQRDFPLHPRPFEVLAKRFQVEEDYLIEILKEWQKEGKLRQISAIFEPKAFRHNSSLFAFKVEERYLKRASDIINAHPGVSHNYLRNHSYNLWFTLVVPPERDLLKEVEFLYKESGAQDYLYLPILKVFKISTVFKENGDLNAEDILPEMKETISFDITERDKALVKALQEPLPLTSRPFEQIAETLEIPEEEILLWLKEMKGRGALRRFGALFKHQKLGFTQNIMIAWHIPEDRLEEIGHYLASKPFVTHCYRRQDYLHWPFNLYTMCHFKGEGYAIIGELANKLGLKNYLALETLKEYKKVRLRLFYH
ncbi:MAG: hypothetical protein N2327_02175 [Caldimicrobium sp.]|nr:hypothetical protein [Caldimicrobium sp.]MCX7873226.1 hypothetical protein [Caldimicrobium sp.]MDW8094116.1 hypothetical protein [Caldimicrobium sp.]